jgi:hypothetical protein
MTLKTLISQMLKANITDSHKQCWVCWAMLENSRPFSIGPYYTWIEPLWSTLMGSDLLMRRTGMPTSVIVLVCTMYKLYSTWYCCKNGTPIINISKYVWPIVRRCVLPMSPLSMPDPHVYNILPVPITYAVSDPHGYLADLTIHKCCIWPYLIFPHSCLSDLPTCAVSSPQCLPVWPTHMCCV